MAHKYQFGPATRLIHGEHCSDGCSEKAPRSHAEPIYQTSTFRYNSVEEGRQIFSGTSKYDAYSRISNPNHRQLEDKLCVLHESEAAQVFDSGMGAIMALLYSLLKSGDEIIAHRNIYGGTYSFLKRLKKFGINSYFVDLRYPPLVLKHLTKNTKIVFIETPSNPVLDICDFEYIKQILGKNKAKDVLIVVDNTFATPYNQLPLNHGADIVVESLTKYINGIGSHIGGALIASKELMNRILTDHGGAGGMMAPIVASQITDNLKSLPSRMERHNENGRAIAELLKENPLVPKVFYPGLKCHVNHLVARRLMKGFGGVVSFELKNKSKTSVFLDKLSADKISGEGIISQAVSLGSVDSLICCPALSTHLKVGPKERLAQGMSDNLIRFSVGTEDLEDIVYSLQRGFQAIL